MSDTAWVALVLGIVGCVFVVVLAVAIDVIRYWLRKRRRATLRAIVRDQTIHGSCAVKVTWSEDATATALSYVPWQDWATDQHVRGLNAEEEKK